MDDQADQLLRRIERYRGYLREGLNAALAAIYLRQITDDEARLERLTSTKPDRSWPTSAARTT